MGLDDALEYITDDELVEVTPQSIRIRKVRVRMMLLECWCWLQCHRASTGCVCFYLGLQRVCANISLAPCAAAFGFIISVSLYLSACLVVGSAVCSLQDPSMKKRGGR